MKKMILVAMTGLLAVSCVNNKVVKYNEERLNVIEDYLGQNQFVKPVENLEQLKAEGKVDYTRQYISLEKEAEQWQKDRLQQPAQN